MKRIWHLTIILSLLLSSCSIFRGTYHEEENIRIGTYNLWRSDIGKGDYLWDVRKFRLVQSIIDNQMDIFAAEEVDTTIYREIPSMLNDRMKKGRYDWKLFSPYNPKGEGAIKAQALVYRSDKFELLEFHRFWLSPTPDEMSSGWDEKKFKRGACCATLRSKKTGKKFFIMVSHFPLGKRAKQEIAPLVIERAKLYNPEGLPAFFAGDLNTREERTESEILRTYWTDAYMVLPQEKKFGPKGTFNHYDVTRDMETAPRIDYVYFRGEKIKPLKYVCDDTRYDGLYPSDHCPVYVDFALL